MHEEIKVYVTRSCPYCRNMLAWLDKYGVKHSRVVFEDAASKMAFYAANPGIRTVPQLYVGEERIGGWTDLNSHEFKRKVEDDFNARNAQ